MFKFGNIEGADNPELSRPSETREKPVVPSELDKKKLERPSENSKFNPSDETHSKNDGKEKLSNVHTKEESLDKKKPENMESAVNNYFKDLKNRSDCPETIKERPFETKDLKKLSPEETSARRDEFDDKKSELKKQWSNENGQPWPKYDQDVYSSNGKMIRKAGGDYDAHHIQPLGMNGKNEASNITPLHANEHYDKQGVHAPDSPYSKLDKML